MFVSRLSVPNREDDPLSWTDGVLRNLGTCRGIQNNLAKQANQRCDIVFRYDGLFSD